MVLITRILTHSQWQDTCREGSGCNADCQFYALILITTVVNLTHRTIGPVTLLLHVRE